MVTGVRDNQQPDDLEAGEGVYVTIPSDFTVFYLGGQIESATGLQLMIPVIGDYGAGPRKRPAPLSDRDMLHYWYEFTTAANKPAMEMNPLTGNTVWGCRRLPSTTGDSLNEVLHLTKCPHSESICTWNSPVASNSIPKWNTRPKKLVDYTVKWKKKIFKGCMFYSTRTYGSNLASSPRCLCGSTEIPAADVSVWGYRRSSLVWNNFGMNAITIQTCWIPKSIALICQHKTVTSHFLSHFHSCSLPVDFQKVNKEPIQKTEFFILHSC